MSIRKSTHHQKNSHWICGVIDFRMTDRGMKHTFSFSLFTSKLDRFWILHSNWVRLNLIISCFITLFFFYMERYNCYNYSFTDVFVAVATDIHIKVSFNIECFKNFLTFSSMPFTISGAQLRIKQVIKKLITFDSSYVTGWSSWR